MWALWVVGGLAVWLVVGLAVGVVVGRAVRLADRRERPLERDLLLVGNVVGAPATVPAAAERRRPLPLPPIGIALAALAVALEGAGFLLRLTGATGTAAHVFSMDAPSSVPRMYVAGIFGAAAFVGLAGAGVVPGRRTWWTAVGVVAVAIATVKAGGTWHAEALRMLTDRLGGVAAQALSVGLAVVVVAWLWFLARHERRDRRRVLGSLACYAVAAVGLSALSNVAGDLLGGASSWEAGATFVEESGEALSGVAFLIAVLAGIAPQVVLPAGWPLRRSADAHTLELPQQLPGSAGETAG